MPPAAPPFPPFRLLTSFQSLETFSSSLSVNLSSASPSAAISSVMERYFLELSVELALAELGVWPRIHGVFIRLLVLTPPGGICRPLYCISYSVKRCCMHKQMKSWAAGEIRLKILRKLTSVLNKFESNSGFDGSTSKIAWIRQQCIEKLASLDSWSSLTQSRPPVAQMVNTTPRSNKSYFFSS